MRKELRFSAQIDTKEFDKSFAELQRKLQSIYQTADRSRAQFEVKQSVYKAGLGAAPTYGDKIRVEQEERRIRRELDQFIREQVKQQENLGKTIAKQLEQRKELLRVAKDTAEIDRQIATNREKMRASEEAVMKALQDRQRPGFNGVGGVEGALARGMAAYRGAGVGGAGLLGQLQAGAVGFGRGIMSMGIGGVGVGLSALAGGLAFTGQTLQSFNLADRQILAAQGSARANLGQGGANVLQGRGLEQIIYAAENSEALRAAEEEVRKTKRNDLIKLGGAVLGIVGGALLSATGVGSTAGVPMIAAGTAFLSSGYLTKEVIDRISGKYEADIANQRTAAYQQNLEAMRNLDPVRRATFERYQQELMPNLSVQRMTGMDDQQLYSALRSGTNAGFTINMTRQAMSNILSAGGSTKAARENATMVNLLERNYNLTNAATAMGRIAGLTSGANEASASMIKVLAEAVSIGLDDSQFAAEQRRFVDISTEIISRSGAIDSNQRGVIENFARFLDKGQTNMYQIQGAKSAYDLTQMLSGEMSGARGAIQAAALNRDENLRKLNIDQRNIILGMTEEQLRAGGALVEGLAATAGLSTEEFVERSIKMKRGALATRASTDVEAEKLRRLKAEGKENTPEYKIAFSKYIAGMAYDVNAVSKLTPAALEQFVQGNVFGKTGASIDQEIQAIQKMEAGPKTSADLAIAGQAAGDRAFLSTMETFKSSFDDASRKLATFSENIVEAAAALKNINKDDMEGLKNAAKALADLYSKIGVAPQGRDLLQPKGAPVSE